MTMDNPNHEIRHAREGDVPDPALELWLQKLREMHRPEEEIVLLDM